MVSISRKPQKQSFDFLGVSLAVVALFAIVIVGYAVYVDLCTGNVISTTSSGSVTYKAPTQEQLQQLQEISKSF